MDWAILVSLLNAGILSIALLGLLIFITTTAYRGICVLLMLVCFAALANMLEDLKISPEVHLISPIFLLGYGPALYLAVKRLIIGVIGYKVWWHFLPMLLALPFTAHTQSIIAIGTIWRIAYAVLTLKLVIEFNRQLTKQRSDASEVSLVWLGWLISLSVFCAALDLLRLNFQPELGTELNMMGYAASSLIFFIILFLMILILNYQRTGLETLTNAPLINSSLVSNEVRKSGESAADYHSLFVFLDKELKEKHWYTLPRLTLNQLAELSGITTRDISRTINLVAGMSFNDYINQHRLEQVKQHLHVDSDINITELAFTAGFSSKATFNQSFKKATGMTPSQFRTQVQNQDLSRLRSGNQTSNH